MWEGTPCCHRRPHCDDCRCRSGCTAAVIPAWSPANELCISTIISSLSILPQLHRYPIPRHRCYGGHGYRKRWTHYRAQSHPITFWSMWISGSPCYLLSLIPCHFEPVERFIDLGTEWIRIVPFTIQTWSFLRVHPTWDIVVAAFIFAQLWDVIIRKDVFTTVIH